MSSGLSQTWFGEHKFWSMLQIGGCTFAFLKQKMLLLALWEIRFCILTHILILFHCTLCSDIQHWTFTTLTVLSPGWAPPDVPSPSGASALPRPSERAVPTASSPHCPMTGKRQRGRSWTKINFKKSYDFGVLDNTFRITKPITKASIMLVNISPHSVYKICPTLPLLKHFFLWLLMFSSWTSSHDGLWTQRFQSRVSDFVSAP